MEALGGDHLFFPVWPKCIRLGAERSELLSAIRSLLELFVHRVNLHVNHCCAVQCPVRKNSIPKCWLPCVVGSLIATLEIAAEKIEIRREHVFTHVHLAGPHMKRIRGNLLRGRVLLTQQEILFEE